MKPKKNRIANILKFEGSQIGETCFSILCKETSQHLGCNVVLIPHRLRSSSRWVLRTTIVPSAKATSKGHVTLVLTILEALGKVFVWLLQKKGRRFT